MNLFVNRIIFRVLFRAPGCEYSPVMMNILPIKLQACHDNTRDWEGTLNMGFTNGIKYIRLKLGVIPKKTHLPQPIYT